MRVDDNEVLIVLDEDFTGRVVLHCKDGRARKYDVQRRGVPDEGTVDLQSRTRSLREDAGQS